MSVYIVSAKRSPFAKFKGTLSTVTAPELGAEVLKAILKEQNNIKGQDIDQCLVGQVLTAGVGQAPARQTALGAGLPSSITCTTVNKVCGSGLKALMMACDAIKLGQAELVVAGGQENMSLAPYILPQARKGIGMGDGLLKDSLLEDGLINAYDKKHMGVIGELCAEKHNISKQEQDDFAKSSFEKYFKALKNGWLNKELVPITVTNKKKETQIIDKDEQPSEKDYHRIETARPVFKKEGSITAGNASKINDGAAFLLLASEKAIKTFDLKPLAQVLGYCSFAQDPLWFTTAPIYSTHKLLKQIQLKNIDLFEVNEAFSVVALIASKKIPIPLEKLNIHGGAVALGHPIGASGARLIVSLSHALKTHNKKIGLASICLGGGEACSLAIKSL